MISYPTFIQKRISQNMNTPTNQQYLGIQKLPTKISLPRDQQQPYTTFYQKQQQLGQQSAMLHSAQRRKHHSFMPEMNEQQFYYHQQYSQTPLLFDRPD